MFALTPLGCLASTAAGCACSCCSLATKEVLKSSARVAYSVLFTFSMLTAWVLRDFAKPIISKIPWIIRQLHGQDPPDSWFGEQAVFRISCGNFMLFSLLAMVMSFPGPVKYTSDWRDKGIHHSPWPIKVVLWLAFNIAPFFFPNALINFYASVARICSPLFLAIQMLIIIDMANTWNQAWVLEGEEDDRYLYALLAATIIDYILVITLAVLSFHWFAPGGGPDCSFNISVITFGLLLCLAITLATFHPIVREYNQGASLFVSASTALYVSYLGFSALQSEPREYECNVLGQKVGAASGTTVAAGMALTLISTVWAAFRAGSNRTTFATEWQSLDDGTDNNNTTALLDAEELTSAGLDGIAPRSAAPMDRTAQYDVPRASAMSEFQPVGYNYTQFYLIFALASMYIAMLMTGWGSGALSKDQIDVGWGSVWVKIVSQWVAAGLYGWSLFAPAVFPDRQFI